MVDTVALKEPVLNTPFGVGVISKAILLVERVREIASLTLAVILRFLVDDAAEAESGERTKFEERARVRRLRSPSNAPPPCSKMRT